MKLHSALLNSVCPELYDSKHVLSKLLTPTIDCSLLMISGEQTLQMLEQRLLIVVYLKTCNVRFNLGVDLTHLSCIILLIDQNSIFSIPGSRNDYIFTCTNVCIMLLNDNHIRVCPCVRGRCQFSLNISIHVTLVSGSYELSSVAACYVLSRVLSQVNE